MFKDPRNNPRKVVKMLNKGLKKSAPYIRNEFSYIGVDIDGDTNKDTNRLYKNGSLRGSISFCDEPMWASQDENTLNYRNWYWRGPGVKTIFDCVFENAVLMNGVLDTIDDKKDFKRVLSVNNPRKVVGMLNNQLNYPLFCMIDYGTDGTAIFYDKQLKIFEDVQSLLLK